MNCPVDGSELRISERQGVEVDYCPQCRGVWLDRGELDKILDRMAGSPAPASASRSASPSRDRGYDARERPDDDRERHDSDRYDDDRYDSRDGRKKRRRRSFLDDLFDFDLG